MIQSVPSSLSRRDLLQIGALGALAPKVGAATSAAPKAKACILLFPYGSPPQHETFDPKPDALPEIQGELKSIQTNLTGVRIGEGLPNIARIMDRLTVVRSMSHQYAEHGVAYAVSGIPTYTPALETAPRDSRHWPFIGSIVDYLEAKRTGNATPEMPRNIGLPWLLNSHTDQNVSAGPYAAFLGQGFDPIWADYDGKGLKIAPKYTDGQAKEFHDPFAQCEMKGRFFLSTADQLPADVSPTRLEERKSLLERLGGTNSRREDGFDKFRKMAYTLTASNRVRQALDLSCEPMTVRERYGATLFGQSCLCARRLVEAGSKFVTVFWDGYGQFAGCAWDTHSNHYPRLKDYLLPGFDRAFPALILDLEARGMLDDTLVMWISEHGRTPKIDPKPKGAGRHHWSRAYSVALAGGGVAKGKIVGSTDKAGGEVKDLPISPKDILATAFHLLGYDAHTTVPDLQGRPVPIAGDGLVRPELFA